MEEINIKTPDNKIIYGTFVSGKNNKSESLIIFVHGFTGHCNEHIIFNGARFFVDKGFDTYRFNLYAGEGSDCRNFRDTTISLHGEDITTVLKYFKNNYKNIFLVGHSYGGTSLLFTDQSLVESFIFWDPSYIEPKKDSTEHMEYNKDLNAHILDWGIEILVGKDFVNELKNFPDCGELIKKINKPVLLITAGKKGNSKAGIKYFESANEPKKLINIDMADHNFNNWSHEDALLKETYKWINNR